jgi:glycosyltransferase involved in cell wall biosynthesis
MNILMTSLLDMEHDRNGVVTIAQELRELLEIAGHSVRMITPKNTGISDRDIILRLIRRFRRLTKTPAVFLAGLLLTIHKLKGHITAQAHDIDAVIAHDVLTADAALSAVAGRYPILLVCHFWTEPWVEFSAAGLLPAHGIPFHRLRHKMEKVLHNPHLTLVPVSRRNEILVRSMVPESHHDRIQLAYPGISRPAVTRMPKPPSDGIPTLITVGTLDRRKNQQVLPDVASALKKMDIPCRFLIVGAGSSEEKARIDTRAADLGVIDQFSFTGGQDRRTVFELMAQADLYLHTSLEESFGLTLIEAMACQLPVMALAYEALNEILPDTPEAVIPGDATPQEIAAHIAPFLKDPEKRNDLQVRQHAMYERRFSAEAFVSRYLDIIADAAGRLS